MSAILSESQLNDFITPGVACIKPVETLPAQQPASEQSSNPYEVTTEDKVAAENPAANQPAQVSLTDCLACGGCVTSAEAVLISLQSHEEVLNTLNAHQSISVQDAMRGADGKVFVASVSPQARASLAATYGITSIEAGCLIEQLLCGPQGVRRGGSHGSGFSWCLDTNRLRDIVLWGTAKEALDASSSGPQHTNHDRHKNQPKRPILASNCPGWVCYAEKTHPHTLPHLSRLKSPQALAGTLVKSVLARKFGVAPNKIWHLAIMPCFDKKLEASREELTDAYWKDGAGIVTNGDTRIDGQARRDGVRDVDCVITARELLMLAESRGISLPNLPRQHVRVEAFPDAALDSFLFERKPRSEMASARDAGPSGGYGYQVLRRLHRQYSGSRLEVQSGRNPDVKHCVLKAHNGTVIAKTARHYGFKNIQNLVQKLKPAEPSRLLGGARKPAGGSKGAGSLSEFLYIEVMACPGGCTNGGGQVKIGDLPSNTLVEGSTAQAEVVRHEEGRRKPTNAEERAWRAKVDEAYFSAESDTEPELKSDEDGDVAMTNGHVETSQSDDEDKSVEDVLRYWSNCCQLPLETLLYTSFRAVESDVGKEKNVNDVERVAGLASSIGGGW